MSFYKRKSPRLKNFDYKSENYYFITICTHNRSCLFGGPLERNNIGKTVEEHIDRISNHFEKAYVDKYVVMPNHVHMILVLEAGNQTGAEQIIAQFKAGVTRQIRKSLPNMILWQRSFHDHVIRDRDSYEKIWLYIDSNPQRWDKDCFFAEQEIQDV